MYFFSPWKWFYFCQAKSVIQITDAAAEHFPPSSKTWYPIKSALCLEFNVYYQ